MVQVKIFAEGVVQQIRDYLPEKYRNVEYTVTEQPKNNGTMRIGIKMETPGCEISPIVYMEEFYQQIRKGKELDQVMNRIADTCQQALEVQEFPQRLDFTDYDSVKDHLSVQMINTKANQRMLSAVPHREIADLSVICRVAFPSPDGIGECSLKVTNEMIDVWKVSPEEIYQKALENAEKKNAPVLKGINDVMCEAMGLPFESENLLETEQGADLSKDALYVLTNEMKLDGASVLVYPNLQERLESVFPNGCYLLPSSIHEILIVPKEAGMTPKELGELVRNVNQESLSKEMILSDRVYEFDKDGQLCQVPESMKKEKEMER